MGNLTRDPELRYTPQGTAVCTFGLATNRAWVTDTGEKKEEAEFHKVVAWNKLAEICSQLLGKGRRVYIEGRLSTRSWTGQDGAQRQTTEIVAQDMIILDSRGASGDGAVGGSEAGIDIPADFGEEATATKPKSPTAVAPTDEASDEEPNEGKGKSKGKKKTSESDDAEDEEMPF